MALLAAISAVGALLTILIWWYLHVPSNMPKNIPTIPFYVSSIAQFVDLGQDKIYDRWLREPLEKYGAVKFFVASQWNVLCARPEYINGLLRNDDVFVKSGNCEKIPYSVNARFLGNNIISAHGETWKLYSSIMKAGIQRRIADTGKLVKRSRQLVDSLLRAQEAVKGGSGVEPDPLLQRYAIYVAGDNFFHTDFETLEFDIATRLGKLQTAIRGHIFAPLFFSFPILDKYPNIFRNRKRAFSDVKKYEDILYEIALRPRCQSTLVNDDSKGSNTTSEERQVIDDLKDALTRGKINETQFRANVKIVFLAGHEDVQHLLSSALYVLGTRTDVQQKLRTEIQNTSITAPTPETLENMSYLSATLFELLRLYPPISQLTNRKTTFTPAVLGNDIVIPPNTYVGWTAFGVHTNKSVWGEDAREFVPERWGATVETIRNKFRRENARGAFIPFNAFSRKCLGQGFALLQMKVVLFELVRRCEWMLDTESGMQITRVGLGSSSSSS
ncbi:hypothetical protein AJ79_02175 [Helicocarpus griseus UAMH5409]|uniref:Uncharacterized protein n=1 Tax=Helicocarpus griseus UAMH5409 TaxID=1447875 RepID=A0A2B7XVK1_9EURO|nr:hypothetical protein AJ79_02175 [Helicocarpus griseus UAMH5409]